MINYHEKKYNFLFIEEKKKTTTYFKKIMVVTRTNKTLLNWPN